MGGVRGTYCIKSTVVGLSEQDHVYAIEKCFGYKRIFRNGEFDRKKNLAQENGPSTFSQIVGNSPQ